jgi:phosphoribosylformylglycinamidine (FGAM) synthase-like enzyme
VRGYHKPIMIAGGMGNIREDHVQKGEITVGAKLIVLGGPAMRRPGRRRRAVGGHRHQLADLDFASCAQPEISRCQEVIDRCWQLGKNRSRSSTTWVPAVCPPSRLVERRCCGGRFDCARCPTTSRA